jgi:nicotinate-nucleotide pyrophosphorylase (carboxylating)
VQKDKRNSVSATGKPIWERRIPLSRRARHELAGRLLAEDVGQGDLTTRTIVAPEAQGHGRILAKQALVLAGLEMAIAVFEAEAGTESLCIKPLLEDGAHLAPGTVCAEIDGPAYVLLTAERVALNLLQHLSGIATLTQRYVEAVHHTPARIIDTRKTTPGLRLLEKYAVRVGGGHNHRFGLGDGILIKDNHIAIAGSISAAVDRVRAAVSHLQKIEVEVENFAQLQEALQAGADVILLDNMTPEQTREAVRQVRAAANGERIMVESSGGITLDTVRHYAEAGVNLISSGALTHSAPSVDLSFDLTLAV